MEKWTKPELETLDINRDELINGQEFTEMAAISEMVRYQVIYHGTNRQMIPTQMVMALQIC